MSIFSWFSKSRLNMSISHCAEAFLVQMPVAVIYWLTFGCRYDTIIPALQHGAFAVMVWYWSREKCQYEENIKEPGKSNITVWSKGWIPFSWDYNSIRDLVFPILSSNVVVIVVYFLMKLINGV